jgi:hypothetical protein
MSTSTTSKSTRDKSTVTTPVRVAPPMSEEDARIDRLKRRSLEVIGEAEESAYHITTDLGSKTPKVGTSKGAKGGIKSVLQPGLPEKQWLFRCNLPFCEYETEGAWQLTLHMSRCHWMFMQEKSDTNRVNGLKAMGFTKNSCRVSGTSERSERKRARGDVNHRRRPTDVHLLLLSERRRRPQPSSLERSAHRPTSTSFS